ncbi:MAG: malto-oligosyltrehalose trehalohydrolase [Gemmataceae bacterium]|nr:malto-oligosyltrehalose trehalohydrolase [Gemmataceae bacterium]
MKWQPTLGARPGPDGTAFRVWAPDAREVLLVVESQPGTTVKLARSDDGYFAATVPTVAAGDRYRYRVDGKGPFPDPCSRYQPEGVHGPSQVVDPGRFAWSDTNWRGVTHDDLIIYELHIGTFTSAGTFASAIERLPQLAELGVTAIEILPVADFPGQRNWGYDGVSLFAPARCYGSPDDLRRLVDAAHRHGLAVLMDVVYNHIGPDGNYLGAFSPYYFSRKHKNPWGTSFNFDGNHGPPVRRFFLENALLWIHEYHMDGLRLDATHHIVDDRPRHFLAELVTEAKASTAERPITLIAEDPRNWAQMYEAPEKKGWGLDGCWADDFHHLVRRFLNGDRESYYADFSDSLADLATAIRQGWFFTGQKTKAKEPRGTDPSKLPMRTFVVCIQNHDQVGNRAMGERLHHEIDAAAYRAASVLLLTAPHTPMLFMGQEWGATSPFQFFTDHKPELGKMVTEGRRREFQHFSAFSDPKKREKIPDPQARSTFEASKLNWDERTQAPHATLLHLYQKLLHLRRTEPALTCRERGHFDARAQGETGLIVKREAADGSALLIAFQMRGAGKIDLHRAGDGKRWEVLLTTEDAAFSPDPSPPRVDLSAPLIEFTRPGAVILKEA